VRDRQEGAGKGAIDRNKQETEGQTARRRKARDRQQGGGKREIDRKKQRREG